MTAERADRGAYRASSKSKMLATFSWRFALDKGFSIQEWVKESLMATFFFVVWLGL
jgi:Na+/H+ antiporter NhaA